MSKSLKTTSLDNSILALSSAQLELISGGALQTTTGWYTPVGPDGKLGQRVPVQTRDQ